MPIQQMFLGMGGPVDDTSLDGIGGYPTFEIRPWANSGYVEGAGQLCLDCYGELYVRPKTDLGNRLSMGS